MKLGFISIAIRRVYVHPRSTRYMADALDVVARSFNINNKLGPKLEAAAEQNAILRIGWTNAGDPVPKNGELGYARNSQRC